LNQKGSFQFEAKKVGDETLLAQIIAMVQMAQGSKAAVQKTVDKIAGVFVPVVIVISFVTFISWMIAGGENAFMHALLTSVTVLVIACPCALGLATPTAIMVGVGKGAENSILIKDAESLELAHKADAVVLDKTGTITEGKPVVTNLIWKAENDAMKFSSVFLSMEMQSEHPLAEAVIAKLKSDHVNTLTLDSFESITARGVKAQLNKEMFFAGNKLLINDNNISINDLLNARADALQAEAKTVIYFANANEVLCIAGIADKVKETSASAIEMLKKRNLEVYMLTGDHVATAQAVATQVGIKNFRAEVLPSQKAAFIQELQQQGKTVAMVGDGINDSQALAQADISIAMGHGSDIALDTAKITLITSDLRYISKALTLSARTVNGINQNLFWAFVYNIIAIPIAAGVLYPINGFLLNPMIAGAAMALSSLSVVTNSLRLKLIKL
jgi:Cu2+-exporting ATPase